MLILVVKRWFSRYKWSQHGLWMNFQKFKSDSYRVGGRHRSSRVIVYGDITSKASKVRIG